MKVIKTTLKLVQIRHTLAISLQRVLYSTIGKVFYENCKNYFEVSANKAHPSNKLQRVLYSTTVKEFHKL